MLRPGAPSRRGESEQLRPALERHFSRVIALDGEGHVDGGDVLVTPGCILIGLSNRTDRTGAEALCRALAQLGRAALIVETPPGVLHFKTAVSMIAEDTVLATRRMAECSAFAGSRILLEPDDEEAAANALRINATVLIGAQFPRTHDLLLREGFAVTSLQVGEVGKLDAGLSCMSLRWAMA